MLIPSNEYCIILHSKALQMGLFWPFMNKPLRKESDTMIKRQKWPVLALVLSLLTLSLSIMLYVGKIACFGPSLPSLFPLPFLFSLLTISVSIIRARAQSMHTYMLACFRRAMSRAHRLHAVPYGRAVAERRAVCEAGGEALRV